MIFSIVLQGEVDSSLGDELLLNDSTLQNGTSYGYNESAPAVGRSSAEDYAAFIFTSCFMDTVLVWIPCFFIMFATPFHVYYLLLNPAHRTIPYSYLNVIKTVSTILKNCFINK